MTPDEKKQIAREVAMSMLGTPYRWGGDDPMAGLDCSGFVVEILRSVGIIGQKDDFTAESLRQRFIHKTVNYPSLGCLALYGSNGAATHIEFCINDELCIGASGGGSKTLSKDDAIRQNAYIKIKPIRARADLICLVNPF
jgi:hypothetical protein